LTKTGILIKENSSYSLSKTSEQLVPYLSEKNSILAVLLIHIGNNKSAFLQKRNKRPFKNFLGLPGGRILTGESIEQATQRILKKSCITGKLSSMHSLSLEHTKDKEKNIVHSFILILVSAKTKDKLELINIEKNKKNIISSDYILLKKDLNKKIDIKTLTTTKF
jgi:ADP-ribose pyrophosphatase YjhB (NUDIX family)